QVCKILLGMPELYGLIVMYDDEDNISILLSSTNTECHERSAYFSCVDPDVCEVLRAQKLSISSIIMVPCLVEPHEENKYRVHLPCDMVNVCVTDADDSEGKGSSIAPAEISADEKNSTVASVETKSEEKAWSVVHAEMGETKDNKYLDHAKRQDSFARMRTLSSRPRMLHKEDYPFVVNAFAAQGLKQTPSSMVLYFSRRIGLFHLKKDEIISTDGCVDQYIRGIVTSPNNFSYIQGIAQPDSAKSVKIVKTLEIIFKGCALLGYNTNPIYNDKAEMWTGWNDYTGLLSFDYACTRLLKSKHREFDSRCGFVMFSASLNRIGKWKVKDVSYSRQEIVENESQMPLDICFVEGLVICHRSVGEIKLVSKTMKTFGGKDLVVSCKKEFFDASWIEERIEYGAVIVPSCSHDGTKVEFEAIAVLPKHKWADPSTQFNRLAAILPTWEEHELPTVPETSFFLDISMEKGYL
ncbi:hypothetical protein PENTCL1PPCAC_22637, partial [Pristionchus entomophagus]